MRAIDTNLVIRLITRDDAEQTRRAEEFVTKGAWVSHLVLVEAVWVLESVYDVSSPNIAITIEMLLNHERLILQDPDAVAAALGIFRTSSKADFSDCLILETARKAGHLPLGTFDRTLAKLDGAETP